MLAAVDLHNEALVEANEIENIVPERHLTAKFECREPPVAQQAPHCRLRVSGFAEHCLGELADALGDWSMSRCLRLEPLTRRLASRGATLSHKGRGKVGTRVAVAVSHTRIGIRT